MEFKNFDISTSIIKAKRNNVIFNVGVMSSPRGETSELVRSEIHVNENLNGDILFKSLFPYQVCNVYNNCLSQLGRNEALRIRLHLQPQLQGLPWESMIHSSSGHGTALDVLSLNPQISITRYQDMPVPAGNLNLNGTIRCVFSAASPEAEFLPHIDVNNAERTIRSVMEGIPQIDLIPIVPATFRRLEDSMSSEEETPFFVFFGHGNFPNMLDSNSKGTIYLEDIERGVFGLDSEKLSLILRKAKTQLAIFISCNTAKSNPARYWDGIATALVKSGVTAIIAMQDSISLKSGLLFLDTFMQHLIKRQTIDEALSEARYKLFLGNSNDWAKPVLYMRDSSGVLFNLIESIENDNTEKQTAREKNITDENAKASPRFTINTSAITIPLPDKRFQKITAILSVIILVLLIGFFIVVKPKNNNTPYNILFAGFNDTTRIILSNPPVYKYLTLSELNFIKGYLKKPENKITDKDLNSYFVEKINGQNSKIHGIISPYVIANEEQYTGMGEAHGIGYIETFLRSDLKLSKISIGESREYSSDEMKNNAIILGGWIASNVSLSHYSEDEITLKWICKDGYICSKHDAKDIVKPSPDYVKYSDRIKVTKDYALITRVPLWKNKLKTAIFLEGINSQGTQAAALVISNKKLINSLRQSLLKENNNSIPKYFQAIISVEISKEDGYIRGEEGIKIDTTVVLVEMK